MMFLEGIRVLDVSRVLAGPLASQILADQGAEVLKIEPPTGDETRSWGPPFQDGMSAYFQSCNRNKKSLVLNLKEETDVSQLEALIAVADIWIDNYPGDVKQRLGLTPERLWSLNPDLIVVSITSYPANSKRSGERGYDLVMQAESGFMGLIGPVTGPPFKVGLAVIDVLTGMMAANAALAGLVRRLRSGHRAYVEVSLYQTALFSLVNIATNTLQSGKPSQRFGNAHPNIVPYEAFPTSDGVIVIGVGNDSQFRSLCSVLGLAERWQEMNNAGRVANREALVAAISAACGHWTQSELLLELKMKRIPCGPILRPDEALAACQIHTPSAILAIANPHGKPIKTINNPLVGDGTRQHHHCPPRFNEGGKELAQSWLANIDLAQQSV